MSVRKLKICLYHDALIPPPAYGGTERLVHWMGKALVSLGHSVTLLARPGSQIPGCKSISLTSSADWENCVPSDIDLVHLWASPATPPKRPYLVTIGGNGKANEKFLPNTVFISGKHARNHGAQHFVYNGIDPDDYDCFAHRENYAVFLAKASWSVKNLKGAIYIARKAGVPLHVLGSRNWMKYLPPIRGVYYHGMVGDAEKRKWLSQARALIFPVRWHEPFGLAVTEALASGCYVLGTPYGSLPEIVTPKVGKLSIYAPDLIDALKNPERFDPSECRSRVYEGFTHIQMAEHYLKLYETVLTKNFFSSQGASHSPHTQTGLNLEKLLPWFLVK